MATMASPTTATSSTQQDWQDCSQWFIRLGLVQPDHRSTESIYNFAMILRDGVLLCRLVILLKPNCLDLKEISLRPQMAQFLCLRNIRQFLLTCKTQFELKDTELFQPTMLFNLTNFQFVLYTLSRLSCCETVVKLGKYPGFIVHQSTQTNGITDNDLLRRLSLEEQTSDENNENRFTSDDEQIYYYNTIGQEQQQQQQQTEEDIYQDLCYIHLKKGQSRQHPSTSLQQQVTTSVPTTVLFPNNGVDYVKAELLETEKNYVDVLNMLKKKFIKPLYNYLQIEQQKTVFFGIKDLADLHTTFLLELQRTLTNQSQCKQLDQLFTTYKLKLLIYAEYCTNLPQAQLLLEDLTHTNEPFNTELVKYEMETNNGKFKLRDLLSVPMQRILKYHLLLQKLYDELGAEDGERRIVVVAKDCMCDVAEYINEVKRDDEMLNIIRQIEGSIYDLKMPEGLYLKDYGRLQKDGELKIRSHDDARSVKTRYVFVFDKVMLMCKSTRGDQYSYKNSICLQEYKIEDINPQQQTKANTMKSQQNSFNLTHHTFKNVYTLITQSANDKSAWIKSIQSALSNIYPLTNTEHNFIMHNFERGTFCASCSKLFKGLFYQGYKCLKCSVELHKECLGSVVNCLVGPNLPPRPDVLSTTTTTTACTLDENKSSYINLELNSFTWFVGELDRENCVRLLSAEENGTFLVRMRMGSSTACAGGVGAAAGAAGAAFAGGAGAMAGADDDENGKYVVSLRWNDDIKHMKILKHNTLYYLSESRYFKSIVELIHWYSIHSLCENFSGLDACLEIAYERQV